VLLAILLLTSVPGVAQRNIDLLLPTEHTLAGLIVDQDGNPLPGARIEHVTVSNWPTEPLAGSNFELRTRAPYIVIRKPGYWSARVQTSTASDLRITLRALDHPAAPPVCPPGADTVGIADCNTMFRFHRVPGIQGGRQGRDIDSDSRGYFAEGSRRRLPIVHGSGHLWSYSIPGNHEVWTSINYTERVLEEGPLGIVDARGQIADGRYWRYIGMLNESVTYREADRQTAAMFDQFLDGLCLAPLVREGR